jgi:integrase
LTALTADRIAQACTTAWGSDAAARTWNRHVAAIRSFATWASAEPLTLGLTRREEVPSTPSPLDVGALWSRTDVALREVTLWRLLHESGAGVGAVLALNVEDLDLDDRRARSGGGGWVGWRSGTARLLPGLLGGRARGPVFLTDRRAGPGAAEADVCPETGRGRLSYERAEYLFKRATGSTLRQLKP